MNRCEQRNRIIKTIKNTDNWDMLDKIEDMFKEEPKYITDFIRELIFKNYDYFDNGKIYCTEEVIKAFEYDVRRIWLDINNKLVPRCEYIDHWSELNVKTKRYEEELDLWISEQGYMFNTCKLCWVIFNIWCGKVTFNK